MARVKLIQVKRTKIDIEELATAALIHDHEKIAIILDSALEFTGPAGAIIERLDQPLFQGLTEILCDVVQSAVGSALDRVQAGG